MEAQDPSGTEREEKYKEELMLLKRRVLNDFDLLMDLNPNKNEDIYAAREITKELQERVSEFSLNQLKTNAEIKIESLEVKVQEIKKHQVDTVLGECFTFIAMKNATSYMIATAGKGLKIFEDGQEVFSGPLPGTQEEAVSLISPNYIESVDSYFLNFEKKIFRKDIDQNPAYHFMDTCFGAKISNCLKYSKINNKFIYFSEFFVEVLNLEEKEVDFKSEKLGIGVTPEDIDILGEEENRVSIISSNGLVILFEIDFVEKNFKLLDHYLVRLNCVKKEDGASIAGSCGDQQYILVEIGQLDGPSNRTRMLVFKVEEDKLKLKFTLKSDFRFPPVVIVPLCFFRSVGEHFLWVGLERGKGKVCIFDYNAKNGVLKLLDGKSVGHGVDDPFSLYTFGDDFYYVGWSGRVMRLTIDL